VGDDGAETYLRLLAETELRRVRRLLEQVERPDGGPDPVPLPAGAFRPGSEIAGSVARIGWAGDVLAAAGVVAGDLGARIGA